MIISLFVAFFYERNRETEARQTPATPAWSTPVLSLASVRGSGQFESLASVRGSGHFRRLAFGEKENHVSRLEVPAQTGACNNGERDGQETDIDCGGGCECCNNEGSICLNNEDCCKLEGNYLVCSRDGDCIPGTATPTPVPTPDPYDGLALSAPGPVTMEEGCKFIAHCDAAQQQQLDGSFIQKCAGREAEFVWGGCPQKSEAGFRILHHESDAKQKEFDYYETCGLHFVGNKLTYYYSALKIAASLGLAFKVTICHS